MNLLLVCFISLFQSTVAYKKYATPISIMESDQNGVYAYDMIVKRKLTMSFHNDNVHHLGTPVDYDPATQRWSRRNRDQLVDCFQNFTMNPQTDANDSNNLEDVLVVDGLHKRVIVINGNMPGEPIVVPYMSEVWIRVKNMVLMDSMTIHVHGLDKHGMWYMDGVAFVQQCPIQSMNYFEYRFIADNKGTHWYHGHMQTDRGDGLAGGFVVVDPNNRTIPTLSGSRLIPSREYFLLLQDWATKSGEDAWMQLEDKTMKWMYGYDDFTKCWEPTRTSDGGNVGGAVPISAILLNDKGWYQQDVVQTRPFDLPLERFQIKANEDILFRIVNGGVAQELMLYVEGHTMVIVAADGEEVIPKQADKLIVFPGERYDVYIKGLAKPTKKSYRIQVETVQKYFFDWKQIPTTYGFGFVEYEDKTLVEDKTPPNLQHPDCTATKKCLVLNCPFHTWKDKPFMTCMCYDHLQNPAPDTIDTEILQATPFTDGYEEHFINMHHDSQMDQFLFQFPWGIPYFHGDDMESISTDCARTACVNHTESDMDLSCRCFYHLEHKLNNIVQITLYNMGLGGAMGTGYAHPFHMHGVHFYVMKVGWPTYTADGMVDKMNTDLDCPGGNVSCNGIKWRNKEWLNGAVGGMNVKNPSRRDTITLPVGGYITIRFRATNPGWWFAHCHLELHLMGGTGYAFKVGDDSQIYMPPPNFPKDCGSFKVSKLPELVLPTPTGTSPPTTFAFSSLVLIILYVLIH